MNDLQSSIAAYERYQLDCSRRTFLKRSFAGLGGMALSQLMGNTAPSGLPFLQSKGGLHFPARAKRVVHLCMAGGPSHLESFDPKAQLNALHGKPFPESFTAGQQLAQLQGRELIARGTFTKFKRYGKSGIEISDLFPHIGSIADDICVIRSMVTEQINHDPAHAFMNTGSILKGRPSMGSWMLYGLGAETHNLPGYVVMVSRSKHPDQPISARRMLERGVRFVQLYHRGWDHHNDIEKLMPASALLTDQASAGLVKDLKQRGLLDDTLVIWGGEFGRTPMGQGSGRDHHIKAFSIWMAGAGIKPGIVHGSTDELGYAAVENEVHVRDLHATLLHQFGIDHARFSTKFQGLDYKLTGVKPAAPIEGILL